MDSDQANEQDMSFEKDRNVIADNKKDSKNTKSKNGVRERRNNKNIWKLGTWNVRSLKGKEIELQEEFEKAGLDILTITETKKKGNGILELDKGHILIYSGVDENKRAAAGVGCIIHKKIIKKIQNWKACCERILTVEMKEPDGKKWTIIVVYGPNDDDRAENKDKFWEDLTLATEEAKGTIYILGDFNSRVGKRDELYDGVLGTHGENVRNNNGRRMLDFCIIHNLIITNTCFEHKDIHKYTREVKSRGEKSIIDYILINKNDRKTVMDTKVRRGPEIGSDHFVVISKIKDRITKRKNESTTEQNICQAKSVKTYKLRNPDVAQKYQTRLTKRIENEEVKVKNGTIEEVWNTFKNIITDTAKEICGVSRKNNKKHTAWWTEEIKNHVKSKKKAWKNYLSEQTTERYEEYKRKRKKVKELVTAAKKETWKEFGEKMEQNSKENQKLFYRVLKSVRNDKRQDIQYIQNKEGEMLMEQKEIIGRWKEYFEELLGEEIDNDEVNEQLATIDGNEEEKITMNELDEAIDKLKNGKAPGSDKISAEMIKYMGLKGRQIMLDIYNRIWKEEELPNDWRKSLIVPIYKNKGNKSDCNNYRGISLLSTAMKILEQIIDKRMRTTIESTFEESQSGFRGGRSTQDQVFSIKQITQKALQEKRKVFLAFIDLEKAFDKVPREKLWNCLKEKGVNNKLIRLVSMIYNNNINSIIANNMESETFTTTEGLRQGGCLSPFLFITYMDDIIKKCTSRSKKFIVGHINLNRVEVSEGVFADDVTVIAKKEEDLQYNLEIWNTILKENGMTINKNKTKVMAIGEEHVDMNIEIDGIEIEQVKVFQYLGVTIDENATQEAEVNKRIEKTLKLYYSMSKKFINKKEVSRKTKIKVFKAIYRPILTFGCESWILNRRQKSKIQAIEMKYLRRVRGVTKKDRMRNTEIRKDLEIMPVLEFIEQRQLGWWGHLHRMGNTRQTKRIWEARIMKNKRRGRPRQKWDNVVIEILEKKGKTWNEAKNLAKNRKEWKKFIKC